MTTASNQIISSNVANSLKEFALETPPEVVVSLIVGVALNYFNVILASPLYGVVLGSTVSRFTLLVISKLDSELAGKIIEASNQFHEKFAIIPIILMIAATALAWFVPIAGLVMGVAMGIYYGAVAERNLLINHQETDKDIQQLGV